MKSINSNFIAPEVFDDEKNFECTSCNYLHTSKTYKYSILRTGCRNCGTRSFEIRSTKVEEKKDNKKKQSVFSQQINWGQVNVVVD